MATQGGPATRQIRIASDLADMIAEIVEVEGGTAAELLDPMLRTHIQAKHDRIRPAIEAIESAKRAYAVPELGTPVG